MRSCLMKTDSAARIEAADRAPSANIGIPWPQGTVAPSRSALDATYSMSSTMTGQEVARHIADYAVLSRRMHRDQSAFVDPYTGKVRAELVTYRERCPLCASREYRFIFAKHGFDHMVCEVCDLIFTLQVLDPARAKHIESADDGDTYGELK